MVKHYPLDGIQLVEVCEELADTAEYKLSRLGIVVLALMWVGFA